MGFHRKTHVLEPIISYDKILKHGYLPHLIRKGFDYASNEQYKALMDARTQETPAPNTMWDDGK